MKKIDLSIGNFIILLLGVLASLMIFFPALAFEGSETFYKGTDVSFGTEIANLGSIASGQIDFNILAVLAYLLPVSACLTALFFKKAYLFSAILFTGAAVLLFMLPNYTTVGVTILGSTSQHEVDWSLAYGLIAAASLSVCGVIVSLFQASKSFKK